MTLTLQLKLTVARPLVVQVTSRHCHPNPYLKLWVLITSGMSNVWVIMSKQYSELVIVMVYIPMIPVS